MTLSGVSQRLLVFRYGRPRERRARHSNRSSTTAAPAILTPRSRCKRMTIRTWVTLVLGNRQVVGRSPSGSRVPSSTMVMTSSSRKRQIRQSWCIVTSPSSLSCFKSPSTRWMLFAETWYDPGLITFVNIVTYRNQRPFSSPSTSSTSWHNNMVAMTACPTLL